jgi:hypothetical protein
MSRMLRRAPRRCRAWCPTAWMMSVIVCFGIVVGDVSGIARPLADTHDLNWRAASPVRCAPPDHHAAPARSPRLPGPRMKRTTCRRPALAHARTRTLVCHVAVLLAMRQSSSEVVGLHRAGECPT